MVILGFMLNYALRVNVSIAILDMVKQNKTANETSAANLTTTNGFNQTNITTTTIAPEPQEDDGRVRFDWTEPEQQMILGSFFWGYVMTGLLFHHLLPLHTYDI